MARRRAAGADLDCAKQSAAPRAWLSAACPSCTINHTSAVPRISCSRPHLSLSPFLCRFLRGPGGFLLPCRHDPGRLRGLPSVRAGSSLLGRRHRWAGSFWAASGRPLGVCWGQSTPVRTWRRPSTLPAHAQALPISSPPRPPSVCLMYIGGSSLLSGTVSVGTVYALLRYTAVVEQVGAVRCAGLRGGTGAGSPGHHPSAFARLDARTSPGARRQLPRAATPSPAHPPPGATARHPHPGLRCRATQRCPRALLASSPHTVSHVPAADLTLSSKSF
mgnify:CR=1 FL=1